VHCNTERPLLATVAQWVHAPDSSELQIRTRLQADYNRRMGEVVFGYSEEGGFLGIGSEQVETTRAMSRRMKAFLDRELLEGRIPDRFGAVAGFQQLLAQAGGASSRPAPTP
jgi:hypothetical protein